MAIKLRDFYEFFSLLEVSPRVEHLHLEGFANFARRFQSYGGLNAFLKLSALPSGEIMGCENLFKVQECYGRPLSPCGVSSWGWDFAPARGENVLCLFCFICLSRF